jgi:hypothetical protein
MSTNASKGVLIKMRRWITAYRGDYFACPKCGALYSWEEDGNEVVFVHWGRNEPCEHLTGEYDETADPNILEVAFCVED